MGEMLRVAAPVLLTSTVGWAVVALSRPAWPRVEALAAALLLGPVVTTLLCFAGWEAGVPYGPGWPLALGLAGGGLALVRTRARKLSGAEAPAELRGGATWWWVLPSLALLAYEALRLWALPGPDGDGLLNFGLKARALHREGALLPFLREPLLQPLHPSYPPYAILVKNLGYVLGGTTSGWAAVVGEVLLLPAMALFAAARAHRHAGWVAGALAWMLVALTPAALGYALQGYADLALAGLLLVAACSWLEERPPPILGALALGLLPWIKLEGLIWGAVVGGGAALRLGARLLPASRQGTTFSWRDGALALLAASLLAAIWPLVVLLAEIPVSVQEDVSRGLVARARAWGPQLRALVFDPGGALGGGLLIGVVASMLALAGRAGERSTSSGGLLRRLAGAHLALVLVAVLLPILRGTKPGHDTAMRLLAQVLPVGMIVAAILFGEALRGRAGERGGDGT